MIDEGPSPEDLNRFAGETAHCPECGEEIWDQAEFCPACKAYIAGETISDPPVPHDFKHRMIALIAFITLLAFVVLIKMRVI